MSEEVVEYNAAVAMDTGSDSKMPVENGKVNITFGSHGGEEPANVEGNKVSESNLPKNAVDDWPEPKQIHSFHVVRYRPIEDQNLKAKLDVAEKELQKKNQARVQLIEKVKAKRADRSQVVAQIRSLSVENRQFRTIMDEKRKEMEPLHQALGKLRGGSAGGGRERSSAICSSEEELNAVIKSLQYRIQHESIPLSEEKQILREIKQLEGTRVQVIANAAERAKIQDSLGEKEAIQDQVKLIGVGLDGARKEKQVINAKLKQLDDEKLVIDKAIGALEEELTALTEKRDKTYESIKEMRKQREDGNTPFYENRNLLTKAKVLAANKDIESLKELVETEVEKFVSLWNSNKAFRDDYERRILPSLDMRQLSRDGRLRNPNEKPLVQPIVPTPSQPEVVKISSKQPAKEDIVISPAQADSATSASEEKPEKAKNDAKNNKAGNKKTEINKTDIDDEEDFFVSGKLETVPKIDEKKLKEMKKEEEIAKRIQAEERKKKQAEKATAKAAIKAQKEAEKKLKEREKRARKKSGAVVAETEEPTEAVTNVVSEEEKIEEKVETPVPQKNKERKESIARNRPRTRGGADSLPKALLKRKKATNYYNWMYIAPAAVAITLVLVAVGYSYLI